MPDQQQAIDEAESEDYPALDSARWFITAAAQNMAVRFGPFDGSAVGAIVEQANAEGIGLLVAAVCGPEVDWHTLRAFKHDRPLGPDRRDLAAAVTALLARLRHGSVPDEAEIATVEAILKSAIPE